MPRTVIVATLLASSALLAPSAWADEPFKWTGFYLGTHTGYVWANTSNVGGSVHPSSEGGLAGVQAGYNWQHKNFVLGVEASFSKLLSSATERCPVPTWGCSLGVDWQADVRGRIGVAFGNLLLYGTVGVAWVREEGYLETPNHFFLKDGSTRAHTIFGGGLNYALTRNVILGLEYLRADFGTELHFYDSPDFGYSVPMATETVRFKVDYKF